MPAVASVPVSCVVPVSRVSLVPSVAISSAVAAAVASISPGAGPVASPVVPVQPAAKARPAPTPVTPVKRVANRGNARKSTGPASNAGRAASARNAVRHGMYSTQVVLPDEDAEEYRRHVEDILRERTELAGGELSKSEQALTQSLADLLWKQARLERVESEMLQQLAEEDRQECGAPEGNDSAAPDSAALLSRRLLSGDRAFSIVWNHQARLLRMIKSVSGELRSCQKDRERREDRQRERDRVRQREEAQARQQDQARFRAGIAAEIAAVMNAKPGERPASSHEESPEKSPQPAIRQNGQPVRYQPLTSESLERTHGVGVGRAKAVA